MIVLLNGNPVRQWFRNMFGRPAPVRYEWFDELEPIPEVKDGITTRSFCVTCFGTRTFAYDPERVDPTVSPRPSRGWHCKVCDAELITADRLVAQYV